MGTDEVIAIGCTDCAGRGAMGYRDGGVETWTHECSGCGGSGRARCDVCKVRGATAMDDGLPLCRACLVSSQEAA